MLDEKRISLAKYRLERAAELISDAKKMLEIGSYKSGNNRAYYSIFHSMRAILALDEVDYKKHSGVIQHFHREYIKTGLFDKKYSTIIVSSSEIRNASDYDDFFLASKDETIEQINNAEEFYEAVYAYVNKKISE